MGIYIIRSQDFHIQLIFALRRGYIHYQISGLPHAANVCSSDVGIYIIRSQDFHMQLIFAAQLWVYTLSDLRTSTCSRSGYIHYQISGLPHAANFCSSVVGIYIIRSQDFHMQLIFAAQMWVYTLSDLRTSTCS